MYSDEGGEEVMVYSQVLLGLSNAAVRSANRMARAPIERPAIVRGLSTTEK